MTDSNDPKETPEAPSVKQPIPAARVRRRRKVIQEAPKKVPLQVVLIRRVRQFFQSEGLPLIRELFSPDQETRKMTTFFLLSVGAFLTLMGSVFYNCGSSRFMKLWDKTQESARARKAMLHREREKADQDASWLKLDKFTFDLRPDPSERKDAPSRLVEFDVSVQGDSPETRNYLEENMVQARNAIFGSLTGWDRETLMTPEGKKKLRQRLSDSLNTWLPEGKVVDLYFVRFIFKK